MAKSKKQIKRNLLEEMEDKIWDKLASERDTKDAKFISHEEFWSKQKTK